MANKGHTLPFISVSINYQTFLNPTFLKLKQIVHLQFTKLLDSLVKPPKLK